MTPVLTHGLSAVAGLLVQIFPFENFCDLEARVWGHSRSLKMTPFDRSYITSYSHSVVTMALSRVVSDIQRDNHAKRNFRPHLPYSTPRGAEPRPNFQTVTGMVKLEWWGYQVVEKVTIGSAIQTILDCADTQTDRQPHTGRQHRPHYAQRHMGKNKVRFPNLKSGINFLLSIRIWPNSRILYLVQPSGNSDFMQ